MAKRKNRVLKDNSIINNNTNIPRELWENRVKSDITSTGLYDDYLREFFYTKEQIDEASVLLESIERSYGLESVNYVLNSANLSSVAFYLSNTSENAENTEDKVNAISNRNYLRLLDAMYKATGE